MPSLIMRTSAVYWTPVMVSSDLPLTLAAACGWLTILFSIFFAFHKQTLVVVWFVNRTNKLLFYECIMVSFLLRKNYFCLNMKVEPVLFVMFLID